MNHYAPTENKGSGALEMVSLLLMTVGGVFLWVVGPLLGVGFAWASQRWTRTDKVVATVIVAAGLFTQVALFVGLIAMARSS